MENQQKEFMLKAIKLAKTNVANHCGGPFGAVVVKDGKIIGTGTNSVTSDNDPTAHAEIKAIRNACEKIESFKLDGCEIYASCEPCPMCLSAIYWARIEKIYYAANQSDAEKSGFDDSVIYNEIMTDWKNRKIISDNICREDAKEVFLLWNDDENKIDY